MSARPDFKGDYMGFTYGNKHSSDLGIVRVSNGSRFDENLLPTLQDKTVQVPGGDGVYYFGSYYTQRQFNISFAFDSLTEQQLADIKSHFGDKKVKDLIFDETPYKAYRAKVTGTATIKYVPFGKQGERVYKGEGSIQFTCYDPFARCILDTNKSKEELRESYPSIDEWWDAARIVSGKNFGDVPVSFKKDLSGEGSFSINNKSIKWNLPKDVTATLNTKTGVVDADGTLYNKYVEGDLTVKIPVGMDAPDGAVFTCLYF